MSRLQISHSPDLQRLQDEGYHVDIRDEGYVLMHHVPYVTSERQVAYGTLLSPLTLNGDIAARPGDHVMKFTGAMPCDQFGQPLHKILHASGEEHPLADVIVQHSFSSKPPDGYANYYDKFTTYANMLLSHAQALDPAATARVFPVPPDIADESPFVYLDTASSRAGITPTTRKLALPKVAIVGLGGTGSYILDLLAKTPAREIHLYDPDVFYTHNAFRAPGATSIEDLRTGPRKVEHLAAQYARVHKGVTPHPHAIDETNVGELLAMDFVFLAIDGGPTSATIVNALNEHDRPFIEVGMGVYESEDTLGGILRVATATTASRQTNRPPSRFGQSSGNGPNAYSRNIQVADLNALNAVLAVIRYKKYLGFYFDHQHEHFTTYTIDTNKIINEDGT